MQVPALIESAEVNATDAVMLVPPELGVATNIGASEKNGPRSSPTPTMAAGALVVITAAPMKLLDPTTELKLNGDVEASKSAATCPKAGRLTDFVPTVAPARSCSVTVTVFAVLPGLATASPRVWKGL